MINVVIFLFVFGAAVGSIANWAICQLRYYEVLSISPWSKPHPNASARRKFDYLPIVGWFSLRRDAKAIGYSFWIRPLLIELALASGAVWFYFWQARGGVLGQLCLPGAFDAEVWYATHGLLIVLLTVATFIDFDEQTIPDWITIPGTLAALIVAAALPGYRLPELLPTLAGVTYRPLTFCSPYDIADCEWRLDWRGIAAGCGTVVVWMVAVMPKIATTRFGIWRGIWLLWASMVRPNRRRGVPGQNVQRGPFATTWLLFLLGAALCAGTAWVWMLGGVQWDSFLGALMGLAFGGGLVWGVRLIGSAAMGQEAMGFGDVTLMAMIGAFLGWQAALLVFALAPFAALFIAIAQFVLSRSRVIAFGPYLSLAALLLIIFWSAIWNENAKNGVFQLGGPILLAVIAGALVAMGLMLLGLRWLKGLRSNDEEEEGPA